MELDPKLLVAAALLVVFALILLALRAGWRAKARSQADIAAPPPADAVRGELVLALDDVHYVATTLDQRPLERVMVAPLAMRGRCAVEVRTDGVRIAVRGAEPFAIPAHAISSIGTDRVTIDRVVERDGLTAIAWVLGDGGAPEVLVHSTFRVVDRDERHRLGEALATLRPDPTASIEENR